MRDEAGQVGSLREQLRASRTASEADSEALRTELADARERLEDLEDADRRAEHARATLGPDARGVRAPGRAGSP